MSCLACMTGASMGQLWVCTIRFWTFKAAGAGPPQGAVMVRDALPCALLGAWQTLRVPRTPGQPQGRPHRRAWFDGAVPVEGGFLGWALPARPAPASCASTATAPPAGWAPAPSHASRPPLPPPPPPLWRLGQLCRLSWMNLGRLSRGAIRQSSWQG